MGKVSEFQTRKFASSAVGTPGVDFSAAQALQATGQGLQRVANEVSKVQQKRKEVKDTALANRNVTEFSSNITREFEAHKVRQSDFRGEPQDRAQEWEKFSRNIFDNQAKLIPTEEARLLFQQQGEIILRRSIVDEVKEASANQINLAFDDGVATVNNMAVEASEIGQSLTMDFNVKTRKFNELMAQLPGVSATFEPLLDTERRSKFNEESPEMMVNGMLSGLIETSPQEAVVFLQRDDVKKILGVEKHASQSKDAVKRVVDFKNVIKEKQFLAVAAENSDLFGRVLSGGGSLAEIDNLENPIARKIMRSAWLENNPISAAELLGREAGMLKKFESFFKTDFLGNITNDLKKDTSPENILDYQLDVMKSFEDGIVTKERLIASAKKFPDLLVQALQNKNKKNPLMDAVVTGLNVFRGVAGGPTSVAGVVTAGGAEVDEPLDEESQLRKTEMTNIYLDRLDQLEDLENLDSVLEAIGLTVRQFQIKTNVNRSRYELDQTVETASGLQKVVGYDVDGEPLVEPVIK